MLVDGKIPAHTKCPWTDNCGMWPHACHHTGEAHTVPFSCASARGFELIADNKKRKTRDKSCGA